MARTLADVLVKVRADTSSVTPDAQKAGEQAGRALGDGVTRGVDGRLRDAKGKFVSSLDGSLGEAATQSGRKAAANVSKSVSGISFGGVIKAAAGFAAILGPAGVAGEAVKMGIQTAASMQQAQVGFTTLLGSGQKAQDFLKNLSAFAAATPFNLPGLIDTSRMLLGVGVSAQQVVPMLTAFGDAAGAVGISQDAFKRVMIQTTQAISNGKFQTQDLNIIAEDGIPIWKLLAESTGKTVPELRKMAEHGKLLASDVLPALQKQMEKDYGGAMAKQSQTLTGVWSTLQDTVSIGLANALQPLVPMLSAFIPRAAVVAQNAFTVLTTGLSAFFTGLRGQAVSNGSEFAVVMGRIGNAARDVGQVITNDVLPALRTAGSVLGTVIGWFTSGSTTAGLLRTALVGIVGAVVVYNTTMAIAAGLTRGMEIATATYRTVVFLATAATRGWTVAQEGLDGALIANPIGLIIVLIAALVVSVIYAYNHFQTFRQIVQGTWQGIQTVTQVVWQFLTSVFNSIVNTLREDVREWGIFTTAVASAWHNIEHWTDDARAFVVRIFDDIRNWVTVTVPNAFRSLSAAIHNEWEKIKGYTKEPVNFVIGVINRGIIHPFDDLTKIFGGPHVADIPGLARGGQIPGAPSAVDNMLAVGPHGPLAVASGEYIVNARQTARHRPLLDAINSGVEGFAAGGVVGKISNLLSGALSYITNPGKIVGDIAGLIGGIPGSGLFRDVVKAVPRHLADLLGSWLKSKLTSAGSVSGNAFGGKAPSGALAQWIATAIGITGVPASWTGPLNTLIMRESGGNPNAINLTDSNARAGHPSQGLMQTIPSTFAAYALPGLGGITNPIANIVAGIRYILSRYGTIFNVQQANPNLPPKGYALGGRIGGIPQISMDTGMGVLQPGANLVMNGTGRAEPTTSVDVLDLLRDLIGAVERVAPGVGHEINGAGRTMLIKARAR